MFKLTNKYAVALSLFFAGGLLFVSSGAGAEAVNLASGGEAIEVAEDPGDGPALPTSGGADLLVIEGDDGGFGYNYGNPTWAQMTTAIDAATDSVTVAPDAEDLGLLMSFDAIWVDQRWAGGTLSATELGNLATFLASGRRVVIIGENNYWSSWNSQIVGLGGGTYAGGEVSGLVNALPHPLTTGVGQVDTGTLDGVAVGGTALFDQNFTTLWGDNLLTILSVNAQGNYWFSADNAVFFTNVAAWIGDFKQVPTTSPWSNAILGLFMVTALAAVIAFLARSERVVSR